MMDTRPLATSDGVKQVADVAFEAVSEPWSEYTLADGTVLRVRLVLTGVTRVLDVFDEQGRPVYLTNQAIVSSVARVLPELCRQPDSPT